MPDPTPVGDATGTPDAVGQPDANANTEPQGAPVGETLTRADVEALVAKRTEHLTREIKKLGKAAPTAKPNDDAAAPDTAALTAEAERRADLALDLMAAGMSKDMARRVSKADALLPEGWETADEAIAYIKEQMPGAFATQNDKPRAPGGGGGRNTTGGDATDYSPEAVEARMAEPDGMTWFKAHKDKIRAWQDARLTPAYKRIT